VNFDFGYALEILPGLLRATLITIQATIGGMAIALVLGLGLAIARLSSSLYLSVPATAIVEFIRGTPLLVQLFVLFFVLPRYGIEMSPLVTGITGLGLHYSSYTAEVYRSGILSVPREQWEAASALSHSSWHTWTRIILPQAIPPMVPALGNYFIGMYKDTPLLAIITVQELLGTALADASRSFRYFEPITLVGLIFLVLSLISSNVVRRLEITGR
jgi:polar amino acid transport system permease protein